MTIKCLYIEDDKASAILVRAMLVLAKEFDVHLAESWREGRMAIRREKPDVILLDLHLHNSEGAPLIREVMAEANDAPVIIITTFSDNETFIAAVEEGVDNFLEKETLTKQRLIRAMILAMHRIGSREERKDDPDSIGEKMELLKRLATQAMKA